MTTTAVCGNCDGVGYFEVDRADARGEHYSTSELCIACAGLGDVEVDEEDIAPLLDMLDAEVEWEAPL
jgi:hypothetical protein